MEKQSYTRPEVEVYFVTLERDILNSSFTINDWDNDGEDYGGECWN